MGLATLSGALGGAVSSGVSSAIGGGSFSAGFWGTTAAVKAPSGFFASGFVAASGAFTGGFTTTLVSELANGTNFWKALGNSFENGSVAALGGFALGGILGGIDAVRHHKDFFSGLSTTTETKILADIQSQIPRIEQLQEYDCFPTCVKAADNSYGGTMTKEDAIERLGELYDSRAGTTTSKAALERVGFHNVSLSRPLPYTIGSSLNSGGRVVVTTSNHAMLATGVEIKTITRTASILWYPVKSYTTFINVMNPAGGLYQSINARNLTHAFLFTR